MPTVKLAAGFAVAASASFAAPPGAYKPTPPADAFVQLFEWSWADVATECEQWLGPKGFTAAQVSPPMEHMQGPAWWTRYQPVTYKLVSRSGDEQGFADMVQRCGKAGVGIYVDAVFNHVAAGSGTGTAGSQYGNRATPIYTQEDMHHDGGNPGSNCQISDYHDQHNVQYCDLVGLPDLCTSCEKVQQTVAGYINHLASIGVAGIRIDAAKHQKAEELAQLLSRTDGSLFRVQEVIQGGGEPVTPQMYYGIGKVTEFQYARMLAPNFENRGKFTYLETIGTKWGLMPDANAVNFIDNHDTQRGEAKLTYKNGKLYELANVFMLAHPYGYPRLMSSYFFDGHDQGPPSQPVHGGGLGCGGEPTALGAGNLTAPSGGPWVCEHRWTAIANMVGWRRAAGTSPISSFQTVGGDADRIAFCRGSAACVVLNRHEHQQTTVKVKVTLPPGTYCDVIRSDDTASCPTVVVGADGMAELSPPPLGAAAIHIGKKRAEADSVLVV